LLFLRRRGWGGLLGGGGGEGTGTGLSLTPSALFMMERIRIDIYGFIVY